MVLVKRYRTDKYFHIFLGILILFVLYTYVRLYVTSDKTTTSEVERWSWWGMMKDDI